MNYKFDQMAKGVAESVTRRQALKRFATGLAGMALAGFALSSQADDHQGHENCIGATGRCGKPSQTGLPSCSACCAHSYSCSDFTGVEQCFCQ